MSAVGNAFDYFSFILSDGEGKPCAIRIWFNRVGMPIFECMTHSTYPGATSVGNEGQRLQEVPCMTRLALKFQGLFADKEFKQ